MIRKSSILSRFLFRRFMSGFGTVLFVVCGVIFAITFVEQLPGSDSAIEALRESYTRLLEYIPIFLPLTVFMGTLFTSYNLTKSSESIIISSAGLSPYRGMKPFIIGAILLGFASSLLLNPYSVHLSNQDLKEEHLSLKDDAIWLRENVDKNAVTLRASTMQNKKNVLIFKNAMMLVQDENQKISERVEAKSIKLSDGEFSSLHANVYTADGKIAKNVEWSTKSNLAPKTVIDRYLKPSQVSFWRLPGFIYEMRHIGLNTRPYWVQFWTLLFLPLTLVAMVVLGVAFSQTHERRNYSFGIKFGAGIIACFSLYFIINVFSTIGASGGLPAILSVIAPPLIIIAGAATFIVSFDTV